MALKDMFRKMQYDRGNIRVDEQKRKSESTMESMTRGAGKVENKKVSRKREHVKNKMEIGSPLIKQRYTQENEREYITIN